MVCMLSRLLNVHGLLDVLDAVAQGGGLFEFEVLGVGEHFFFELFDEFGRGFRVGGHWLFVAFAVRFFGFDGDMRPFHHVGDFFCGWSAG